MPCYFHYQQSHGLRTRTGNLTLPPVSADPHVPILGPHAQHWAGKWLHWHLLGNQFRPGGISPSVHYCYGLLLIHVDCDLWVRQAILVLPMQSQAPWLEQSHKIAQMTLHENWVRVMDTPKAFYCTSAGSGHGKRAGNVEKPSSYMQSHLCARRELGEKFNQKRTPPLHHPPLPILLSIGPAKERDVSFWQTTIPPKKSLMHLLSGTAFFGVGLEYPKWRGYGECVG